MKKSALLICGIFCLTASKCWAVSPVNEVVVDGCWSVHCNGGDMWYAGRSPSELHCSTNYTAACVYIPPYRTAVASCLSCDPGYELVATSNGITACAYEDGGDPEGHGSYNYTYCTKNCSASNCAPSDWTALRTGYETRTNRTCSATGGNGTCNVSTQYRCAAGYYGSSTNGTSGCSQCPEAPSTYTNSALTTKARGTSASGTTSQNSCYLAAGTYYDASGTFGVSGTSCTY